MSKEARKRSMTMALVICPIVVGVLVIGGVFLGSSLAGFVGFSKTTMEAAVGTLGLVVSLPIIVVIVTWVVRQGSTEGGEPTSAQKPPSP
ncbi:MAG: hypothetical protein ABSG45_02420 [Nitrososphaerales archaeon]